MALPSTTVWESRTAGGATAGGGFISGSSGTDHTQQDAIQSTRTDIVIDATTDTDITSAADPFAADDVGNVMNFTSGTGFNTGRFAFVVSVAAGVATMSAAIGTTSSTGGNATLGGALPTPTDALVEAMESGQRMWIKADGTHTLAADILMAQDGTAALPIEFFGYNTTRGDGFTLANKPLVDCGAFNWSNDNFTTFKNIEFTGTDTLVVGGDTDTTFIGLVVSNTSGSANRTALDATQNHATVIGCVLLSTNGTAVDAGTRCFIHKCVIKDSDEGIRSTGTDVTVLDTLIESCATGFIAAFDRPIFTNTTIDNCTTGIDLNTTGLRPIGLNLSISNCTTGMSIDGGVADAYDHFSFINFFGNTADTSGSFNTIENETALDPEYVDASGDDYQVGVNLQSIGMGILGATDAAYNVGVSQNKAAGGGGAVDCGGLGL